MILVSHRFRRYKNLSKAIFLGFSFVHLADRRDTYCASGQGRFRTQDLGIPREALSTLHYSHDHSKTWNMLILMQRMDMSSPHCQRPHFASCRPRMEWVLKPRLSIRPIPEVLAAMSGVCSPPFHPPSPFLGNVRGCFYLSFSQRRISVSYSTFAERSK